LGSLFLVSSGFNATVIMTSRLRNPKQKIKPAKIESEMKRVNWVKQCRIEYGSTANIFLVFDLESKNFAIVKIATGYGPAEIGSNNCLILKEYDIMSSLDHPAILKVQAIMPVTHLGVDEEDTLLQVADQHYRGTPRLSIIMDRCSQGCLQRLMAKSLFTPTETKNYLKPIAEAMVYLKKMRIIHRDIKIENILVDKDGCPKLADFGYSIHQDDPIGSLVGSFVSLAPETFMFKVYDYQTDVWGFVTSLFCCLTGRRPFGDGPEYESAQVIRDRIITADYQKEDEPLAVELIELFDLLFNPDPTNRPTIEQILELPFFKDENFDIPLYQSPLKKHRAVPVGN